LATPSFDVAFISKHWKQRTGYFAVLAPMLVLAAGFSFVKDSPIEFGISVAAIIGLLEIVWRLSRRLPRTKNDKLGFVICIACDDQNAAAKTRSELVQTLRRLLGGGRAGHLYQVTEVPQDRAATVISDNDAQILRVETRAHFLSMGMCAWARCQASSIIT
jgi:hypothetical protein